MHVDKLLDELDCPINTDDCNTLPLLRSTPPVEPTASDDTDYDQVRDIDYLPGS